MRSIQSLVRPLLNVVATAAASAAILVGTADARDIFFDFDSDGDPSTIENEVTADVGEILIGYMVVNDFPEEYGYLWAMQFGLDVSDGLELLGWSVPIERAGVLHDGPEGIAIALGSEPFAREDLPVFAVRFIVRVLEESPQSVSIVPSSGWNSPFEEIQLLVSVEPDGGYIQIDSPLTEIEQIAARINETTPIEETSWTAIKRLFEDDTI
jgi:hypothetical protein